MKHRFILILVLCVLSYVRGNSALPLGDSIVKGVQFDGARWQEILKKAKKEKKYVFVDCYATWCDPCKKMDQEVYILPEVAKYVNRHFISFKIQLDKTPTDDEQTKKRYGDADLIQKQNGIPSYPTYFIFSPDGKMVSRGTGYKSADDFLGFVASAIDPKASHPYAKYYAILSDFQKGKKDPALMMALMDTARLLNQTDIADSISRDYNAYLTILSDDELYTPQIISYLSLSIQSSSSRFFHLFHPNEEKVNALMGKNGYAQQVVGRIITNEYITPSVHLITGMRSAGDQPIKEQEPDWANLEKTISDKYDTSYAEENILKARARWYNDHSDRGSQNKYFALLIQKYSANMDANKGDECLNNFMDCDLNLYCWNVFKYSVDKEQIDAGIKCMDDAIKRYKRAGTVPTGFIDTYANLLYKAGRLAEAMEAEEEEIANLEKLKAAESGIREFRETLEKMRQGKPTWPHYIDKGDFFGMGLM